MDYSPWGHKRVGHDLTTKPQKVYSPKLKTSLPTLSLKKKKKTNIDDLSLVITLAKQSEPQRSLICAQRRMMPIQGIM